MMSVIRKINVSISEVFNIMNSLLMQGVQLFTDIIDQDGTQRGNDHLIDIYLLSTISPYTQTDADDLN